MNKKEGMKAKENNLEVWYANLKGQVGFLGGKRKIERKKKKRSLALHWRSANHGLHMKEKKVETNQMTWHKNGFDHCCKSHVSIEGGWAMNVLTHAKHTLAVFFNLWKYNIAPSIKKLLWNKFIVKWWISPYGQAFENLIPKTSHYLLEKVKYQKNSDHS